MSAKEPRKQPILVWAAIILAVLGLSTSVLSFGGSAFVQSSGSASDVSATQTCQAGYFTTSAGETNGTLVIQCSQVGWTQLTGYPSACAANQFVTAVGSTLTCSAVSWAGLTNFPTGCSAGQFVAGVGVTLTCSSVAWSQITGFPSGCASNFVISVIGSIPTCSPFPLMASLAVAYPMEEGSGATTADVSGNSRTQTLTNTPTWQSKCRIGAYCLAFGGEAGSLSTSYTTATFSLTTNNFTISQWIYPVSIAAGIRCYTLATGANFVFDCQNGSAFCADINNVCFSGSCPALVAGKWIMTTIEDNAGTFSFSENGAVCSGTTSQSGNFITSTFLIGGNVGSNTFNGYIDQVMLWNRALSASEISWLYNTQLSQSIANSPSSTNKLTGQTGTVASIVSITSFSANSIYSVGGDLDVTAFTSGTITLQVTYTDWNSGAQTITIDTATALGDAPGNSENILVKASTTITIKTTGIFVATYNIGTWLSFVS